MYAGPHQKTAVLPHGIATSHGFSDGNRHTALYLFELLATRSSYKFVEDDMVVAGLITRVAQGETGYNELADWFRQRLVRGAISPFRPDLQ